ncbi:MAG: site-2 protease family protein [Candidatus Omnitrophica bacterium]|jgi:Zn-dependent protease|nr:site-2 protease family protein [Candidatus Omnitrophota bacterium]MDD5080981.1 site-2 protease family protein [Candidatus Omnitrophota bacterium]MDD5441224.1 site-2 protease family protein [Candidatus Omnitrophota bacterium]
MTAVIFVSTIFFICLHEYIHGYAADKLGDPTVRFNKRNTLNPIAHIDMFGTCCLPLFLLLTAGFLPIGYAKPIPINPAQLRRPKQDIIKICLSGPLVNLFLGIFFAFSYRLNLLWLSEIWIIFSAINIYLFVFNLLPFAPLDGARIIMVIWPNRIMEKYFSNVWLSFLFFVFFIFAGGCKYLLTPIVRSILFIIGIDGVI